MNVDIFLFVDFVFQVFLGNTGAQDIEGHELPRLVYVSREKRPGYQHHKKAGAENALVLFYSHTFKYKGSHISRLFALTV